MDEPRHNIKMASRRTGLTPHVIRIWEKRYGAVKPLRTDTNRRLYSEEEIEKLSLLRDITRSGQSIGPVAALPLETLRRLALEAQDRQPQFPSEKPASSTPDAILTDCLTAVKGLDSRRLQEALNRAATELGGQGSLQRVIAPLAQQIGDLWRDGSITAAHEHFASAVIRVFLGQAAKSFAGIEGAPVLVVATPAGQLHELGALTVGATAANLGWQVTYIGASLPAAEIAGAARQHRARAVALSIVYPQDDPRMEDELMRLRDLLPAETALLVGGRAMPAYRAAVAKTRALPVDDLAQLCESLDQLRQPTH